MCMYNVKNLQINQSEDLQAEKYTFKNCIGTKKIAYTKRLRNVSSDNKCLYTGSRCL